MIFHCFSLIFQSPNYRHLQADLGTEVFEYDVKFVPPIDMRVERFRLLKQCENVIGGVRVRSVLFFCSWMNCKNIKFLLSDLWWSKIVFAQKIRFSNNGSETFSIWWESSGTPQLQETIRDAWPRHDSTIEYHFQTNFQCFEIQNGKSSNLFLCVTFVISILFFFFTFLAQS